MENKELQALFSVQYPIQIFFISEDGTDGYFYAFLPDFGYSSCSATGDTIDEAIVRLQLVKIDVIQYYVETGKSLPEPSKAPFEQS